jgi:hypothetical protein
MKSFRTKIRKASPIGKKIKARRIWGSNFTSASGFSLELTSKDSMAVFVDKRFEKTTGAKLNDFFSKPRLIAHCISTLGHEWTVWTEPTGKNKIGMIVYIKSGKPLMTGTGVIRNGAFIMELETLYDGITNKCHCTAGISGSYNRKDGWQVEGQAGVEC